MVKPMNIARQASLFGGELEPDTEESKYSTKVEAPVYQPRGKKPHILELVDMAKTNSLVREICASSEISQEERQFLLDAAYRHSVFNYEKIADYYAHATPAMQRLMEKSALVIVDFNQAIENGYVKLCEEIRNQYLEHQE
jgi:hypothetical protein